MVHFYFIPGQVLKVKNMFFRCILWLQDFSSMAFLPQINNKRDTIFQNIKIIRVIIPLRTILHGYLDSEEFSREEAI